MHKNEFFIPLVTNEFFMLLLKMRKYSKRWEYEEIINLLTKKISDINKLKNEQRLEKISWFQKLIPMIQKLIFHILVMKNNFTDDEVNKYANITWSIAKHRDYISLYDSCYFRQEIIDKLYYFLDQLRSDLPCKILYDYEEQLPTKDRRRNKRIH